MSESESLCACGSRKFYQDCCALYHKGVKTAPTTLALVRSRYAAFVYGEIDYLVETTFPASRTADLEADCRLTCESIRWVGLEIVNTSQGEPEDKLGAVEFKASYFDEGCVKVHREHSRFCRKGGKWYYIDGVS